MQASTLCYDFIKKCEGYSAHAYDDGGGVQTIGWGTIRWDLTTPVKKGDTITTEEAQRQLEIEVHRVEDAINATVKVPLTQPEFDALVSLFYNIGIGWCTGQGHTQATLIKSLNAGNYKAVPAQLLRFERDIHGRYVDGLAKRRKWECKLWLSEDHSHVVAATPTTDPAEKPMPQTVNPAPANPVIKSASKSWTVWGALTGFAASVAHYVDGIFNWSKTTADGIISTSQDMSSLQTLGGLLLKHADQAALLVTGVAFVIVISRRISAAYQGRTG